jgi:hypothetical protein
MGDRMKVLFEGEFWSTHSVHPKGFGSFEASSYHRRRTELIASLRPRGIDVSYQPSHIAANIFPREADDLREFDVVITSDIGPSDIGAIFSSDGSHTAGRVRSSNRTGYSQLAATIDLKLKAAWETSPKSQQ